FLAVASHDRYLAITRRQVGGRLQDGRDQVIAVMLAADPLEVGADVATPSRPTMAGQADRVLGEGDAGAALGVTPGFLGQAPVGRTGQAGYPSPPRTWRFAERRISWPQGFANHPGLYCRIEWSLKRNCKNSPENGTSALVPFLI